LERERSGEHHTLLLANRELTRGPIRESVGQAGEGEGFADVAVAAGQPRAICDVLGDRAWQ